MDLCLSIWWLGISVWMCKENFKLICPRGPPDFPFRSALFLSPHLCYQCPGGKHSMLSQFLSFPPTYIFNRRLCSLYFQIWLLLTAPTTRWSKASNCLFFHGYYCSNFLIWFSVLFLFFLHLQNLPCPATGHTDFVSPITTRVKKGNQIKSLSY